MGPRSMVVPAGLLLLGAWGLLVPYGGPPLGFVVAQTTGIEVIDHVVPGTAVLAVAVLTLVRRRRTLAGSLVVMGAGGWMTATHVPLLRQAADGGASMDAALWHSLPGMVLLLLGVVATAVDGSAPEEAPEDSVAPPSPPGPAPADHAEAASPARREGVR